MRRFVEGSDRSQSTLFPQYLEDWISEDNPVRVIDVFVDELDLAELGFGGATPEVTGRPSYHPSVLLKLYIYGYLNRTHPERMRLRRETVEHPFGTIKARMGATHFLMKTLPKVATEMALHVLAYNLTRVMNIIGVRPLLAAMRA
jgi:transposase